MKKIVVVLLALLLTALPLVAQEETPLTFEGQIAYIGADYNVYGIDGATGETTALTDDADANAASARLYQWPTWTRDGSLAYFGASIEAGGSTSLTATLDDGVGAPRVIYQAENESLTYPSWSPQTCDNGEACQQLAILLSGATTSDFLVKLAPADGSDTEGVTAGQGAPYYSSWSPDGSQMVWHRDEARIDIYDVAEDEVVETITDSSGTFATPAWSPIDDRILIGLRRGSPRTTDLNLYQDGEMTLLVSGLRGVVAFAWSPDGEQIAYTENSGAVIVIDAVTGEQVTRTPSDGVLAFFWSPNGEHIAYVTLGTPLGSINARADGMMTVALRQQRQRETIAWSVLDVADGANRGYGSFVPTQAMLYLLSFADQFAHSHRVWSPDSRHLVYSEVADERPAINVIDAMDEAASPVMVGEGVIGIWSY